MDLADISEFLLEFSETGPQLFCDGKPQGRYVRRNV